MATIPSVNCGKTILEIEPANDVVVLRIRVPDLFAKHICLDPAAVDDAINAMHDAAADALAWRQREDLVDRILAGYRAETVSTGWVRSRLQFLLDTFALDGTRAELALRPVDGTDQRVDSLPCPQGLHASWWTGLTRYQQVAVYTARGLSPTDARADGAATAERHDHNAEYRLAERDDTATPPVDTTVERSALCRCACHTVHSGRWTDD